MWIKIVLNKYKTYEYKVRGIAYEVLRKLFQKDYDTNEDYVCMNCGRPVLTRLLNCSKTCADYFEHNTSQRI